MSRFPLPTPRSPLPHLTGPLALLVASATLLVAASTAGPARAADTDPGPSGRATASLTVLRTLSDPQGPTYPGTGTGAPFSSPVVADITGDGRPEIVSASTDGDVIAWRTDTWGQLWKRNVGGAVQASVVVADVDRDGRIDDVVVATADRSAKVVWLDGPTGAVKRTFREGPPLHCPPGVDCRPHGFFGTPQVADVTGDGYPEIVAASYDHSIYAWRPATGGLYWRTYLYDTIWSSPKVVDLDGNGTVEVIVGGDMYPGNPLGISARGLVWALHGPTGRPTLGTPWGIPDQVIWSSPAIADIDGNGTLNVIVGTGTNYADTLGWKVYAFGATGKQLPGWPVSTGGRVISSPAVGNLDGDAALEVAVADEGGWVSVYDANGARKWRACNAVQTTYCRSATSTSAAYGTHGGAVIADVDADGAQEVVSMLDKHVRVYNGATGALEDEVALGTSTTFRPQSSAAISEIGGQTVIVQQAPANTASGGGFFPAQGDTDKIYVVGTAQRLCRADWPMFSGDARRSGRVASPNPGWSPFRCARDFVLRQYQDFLGRTGDGAGIAYYVNRLRFIGSPGNWVIRAFMASPEFEGVVAPVVSVHLAVTGLPPTDLAALQAEVAAYRGERTTARLAAIAAPLVDAPALATLDDEGFVTEVWEHAVGATPDPGRVAVEVASVRATSRAAWVAALVSRTGAVTHLEPEVQVTMAYLGMLHRTPDPGGYAYWVGRARAGTSLGSLIRGFQFSAEYAQVTGQ